MGGKSFKKKEYKLLQKKICCPLSLILSFFGHNFYSHALIEKKLYSYEAYQFFYIKKFQKIKTKIQLVGNCLKSHLYLKGTTAFRG